MGDRRVVAVLFVDRSPRSCLPSVTSIRTGHPEVEVVVGARRAAQLEELAAAGAETVVASSLAALANQVWEQRRADLLVLSDAALFPPDALLPALEILHDWRVATVSFLGNDSGFLSLGTGPRQAPAPIYPPGLDEAAATRRLRQVPPALDPVPVPFATGPAVLISSVALSAIGGLAEESARDGEALVADFSARGRRRGFLDLADPSTCVTRLYEDGSMRPHFWLGGPDREWLVDRHPFLPTLVEEATGSVHSPLAVAHAAARAKVVGLQVLIDARWSGGWQMGTQVQAMGIAEALGRHPDVGRVCVLLNPQAVEAQTLRENPDVLVATSDADVSALGPFDIVHRPFQPDGPLDLASWREVGSRVVLSVLDLIAYHVGPYHPSAADWASHRRVLTDVIAHVDGVVAISADVERQAQLERLPVEPRRLFVVPLGTDHVRGDEAAEIPAELVARGFAAREFVLVLGANYAHKNRDLAVRAVAELRRRGRRVELVMAGVTVPFGSGRPAEAAARSADDGVWIIPDVTPEERNWLLGNASVVLYPTSAEGFGFIPYEAARFGTPTVFVPVGPLRDLAAALPLTAADWAPDSLADAAERLLADPALAREQVRSVLAAGETLTWDAAGARLVAVYRQVLALPPLGGLG